MKVIEYLEFFAAAYRIKGHEASQRSATKCWTWSASTTSATSRPRAFRAGMTQRLGLARVLLHDPQVLLLDEPASGLDPRVRIEIRRVIKHLGELGKTVMVSSHILPELADMCNKIGIIEKRRSCWLSTDVADVMLAVRRQVVLRIGVVGDPRTRGPLAGAACGRRENRSRRRLLHGNTPRRRERLQRIRRPAVRSRPETDACFDEDEMNLETAFMALTKGITA